MRECYPPQVVAHHYRAGFGTVRFAYANLFGTGPISSFLLGRRKYRYNRRNCRKLLSHR